MNGLINLEFQGLPYACYPADPNDLATDILNYTLVTFNTSTGNLYYNIGSSTPSVDNRAYPWFKTASTNGWEDGWYYWSSTYTSWVRPNSIKASSDERRLFVGVEALVWAYDGGSGSDPSVTAPSAAGGAMWEVDHDYDRRVPIGPGTLLTDTIDVGENVGSETITLVDAQLSHTHVYGRRINGTTQDDGRFLTGASGSFSATDSFQITGDSNDGDDTQISSGDMRTAKAEMDASPDPVSIIPNARGTFIIKRTARVYYTV